MATIYKLICDDPELVYYGSTVLPLGNRIGVHRETWRKKTGYCSSQKLFDACGAFGVRIIPIQKVSIERKRIREQFYIDNFPCVNEARAVKHPNWEEKRKEKKKLWKQNHREIVNKSNAKYREKHKSEINKQIECECGLTSCKGSISRHRKSQQHQVRMFLKQIEESNVAMPE